MAKPMRGSQSHTQSKVCGLEVYPEINRNIN